MFTSFDLRFVCYGVRAFGLSVTAFVAITADLFLCKRLQNVLVKIPHN